MNWEHLSLPNVTYSYNVWMSKVAFGGYFVRLIIFRAHSKAASAWLPTWLGVSDPHFRDHLLAENSLRYPVVLCRHKLPVCTLLCSVRWGQDPSLNTAPWRVRDGLRHSPPRQKHSSGAYFQQEGFRRCRVKEPWEDTALISTCFSSFFYYSFIMKGWHWCGTTCKLFSILSFR